MYFSPKPPLLENAAFSKAYFDRDGSLLRLTLAKDQTFRLFTPYEHLSPSLINATLQQEDRYFYLHPGVNPVSVLRAAAETYLRRSRPVGGSTITMQVVRLRDKLDTRSPQGKLTQMMRALQLEGHYSKQEILEAYLNLAPYGGNIEGAGAASLIYFRQPADNLALPQSMALAVIPQNPLKRFPLNADTKPWQQAYSRLNRAMGDAPEIPLSASRREDLPFLTPHLTDTLERERSGRIDTTIAPNIQKLFEAQLKAWIGRNRGKDIDNAAVLLVHFPTMEVRALIGSADFHNIAIEGQVDGTKALRSPGSTLKPFVYALALDQGLIHPETLLEDDPTFFGEYRPGNFDKVFYGGLPAREALTLSRNVPAIELASRLQKPDFYEFLQAAGAAFGKEEAHYGLSLVVGSGEVSMRTIAKLYALLANRGILKDLRYTKDAPAQTGGDALLSPEAALVTLTMLERPDPAKLPFISAGQSVPAYWKTGTSNGFRDAWTAGIVGDYVLVVWTGHFDGRSSPALIGADMAAPLFFELANALGQVEKLKDEIHPALDKLSLTRVSVCMQTGAPEGCGNDRDGWFIPGKSPFQLADIASQKPQILSPRSGVTYVASRASHAKLQIPLQVRHTGGGGGKLFWFAGNKFLGENDETHALLWEPLPGTYTIRLVDETGQADSQRIQILTAE
jgi:penicillin-binding protein 1C